VAPEQYGFGRQALRGAPFELGQAGALRRQIEGILAYMRELAPRRNGVQLQRVSRPLVDAHAALHQWLLAHGVAH
jgi:hypothetical protein